MALQCSTDVLDYGDFEFIDCQTINISYNIRGLANISLTVITTRNELLNDYTTLEYGGVIFNGWITGVNISKIPGTLVNQFQLQITAFGC